MSWQNFPFCSESFKWQTYLVILIQSPNTVSLYLLPPLSSCFHTGFKFQNGAFPKDILSFSQGLDEQAYLMCTYLLNTSAPKFFHRAQRAFAMPLIYYVALVSIHQQSSAKPSRRARRRHLIITCVTTTGRRITTE